MLSAVPADFVVHAAIVAASSYVVYFIMVSANDERAGIYDGRHRAACVRLLAPTPRHSPDGDRS